MFVVKVYCKIETTNIVSSRLTAPGSPRMWLARPGTQFSISETRGELGKVNFPKDFWDSYKGMEKMVRSLLARRQ